MRQGSRFDNTAVRGMRTYEIISPAAGGNGARDHCLL